MPSPAKRRWFKPRGPGRPGGRYAWSARMPQNGISGVYAIAALNGLVLYVGESHSGLLRRAITRHLQTWNDLELPRAVYHRDDVQVCWMQTRPDEALDTETAWMAALKPRDNFEEVIEDEREEGAPEYVKAADEEVPF